MWSGNKAATRSDEMEENWNVELDDGVADSDADAESSSTSDDMSLTQLKKKVTKSAQKKVTKKVTKKRRAGLTTQDGRAEARGSFRSLCSDICLISALIYA